MTDITRERMYELLKKSIAHIESRPDRIENRLDPRKCAEAQARFEPHP